jgi:lactoylglutathione lyase
MRYLHTMVRVTNLEQSLDFYCTKFGMEEVRRIDNPAGKFTLVFLAAPVDKKSGLEHRAPLLELTYNYDPEVYTGGRNFGHLAFEVDDIYATCDKLMKAGVVINPTTSQSRFCKRASRSRRRSPGPRCRTPVCGEAAIAVTGKSDLSHPQRSP